MARTFRLGLVYHSSPGRTGVEKSLLGGRPLGYTSRNPKTGKQTYWFSSPEEFNRHIKDIIDCVAGSRGVINVPTPVFEWVDEPEAKAEDQSRDSSSVERCPHKAEAGDSTSSPATTPEPELPAEESAPEPEPEAPSEPAKNRGGRPRKNP